jgi:hypothetical protein
MLFDYVFYRIYRFFNDKGDLVPETKGLVLLSLIQFVTILDMMIFVKIFYEYPIPKKYYFIPLLLVVGAQNWYRYDKNLDLERLNRQWRGEQKGIRVRNGWLVGIYLLVSFLNHGSSAISRVKNSETQVLGKFLRRTSTRL